MRDDKHSKGLPSGHKHYRPNVYEVQIEAIKDDIAEIKVDLKETRSELKTEINDVKTELKTEIKAVRAEINDVKTELKTEIKAVRIEINDVKTELKAEINDVKTKLAVFEISTKWRFVMMSTLIVASPFFPTMLTHLGTIL